MDEVILPIVTIVFVGSSHGVRRWPPAVYLPGLQLSKRRIRSVKASIGVLDKSSFLVAADCLHRRPIKLKLLLVPSFETIHLHHSSGSQELFFFDREEGHRNFQFRAIL